VDLRCRNQCHSTTIIKTEKYYRSPDKIIIYRDSHFFDTYNQKNILENHTEKNSPSIERSYGAPALSPLRPAGRTGRSGRVFWSFSQFVSLIPGKTGMYLRNAFYRRTMTSCHPDSAILFGTIFSQTDTDIGKNVYIGPNCNIGRSSIQAHCTLGSNVHILSGKNQHFHEDLDIPIQEQGGVFEKIIIGEDTWIGNGALIVQGSAPKQL